MTSTILVYKHTSSVLNSENRPKTIQVEEEIIADSSNLSKLSQFQEFLRQHIIQGNEDDDSKDYMIPQMLVEDHIKVQNGVKSLNRD